MKVNSHYKIRMNGKVGIVTALTHITKDAEILMKSIIIMADEGKMLKNKLTEETMKSVKLSETDSIDNYEEVEVVSEQ